MKPINSARLILNSILLAFGATILLTTHVLAAPFGTAFTYQGRLVSGTNPATGLYDFRFSLWDAPGAGANIISTTQAVGNVSISNGLFMAVLDFGAAFDGGARWLELNVRTNGAASFSVLSPRQSLTPAPYALTSSNLSGTLSASQLTGTLPAAQLSGTYGSPLLLNNPANSFSGNGGGLTNVNAFTLCGLGCNMFWNLLGNGGTIPGVNFLGTTDNQPLELKVNAKRALRLEPNTTSPNVIGGFWGNYAKSNVVGATIAGGGASGATNLLDPSLSNWGLPLVVPNFATIGGGVGNNILTGTYSTIGGGATNSIDGGNLQGDGNLNTISGGGNNGMGFAISSTIAGGQANSIGGGFGAKFSTIGGGIGNQISAIADPNYGSTIAGGMSNVVYYADDSTIGGGLGNSIAGPDGTIAGGSANNVGISGAEGSIGGGSHNFVVQFAGVVAGGEQNRTVGSHSAVGGGKENIAFGDYSTVPGGYQGIATNYGQLAHASGQFTSVGDAQTSEYVCRSTTTNATQTELFLDGVSQRMVVSPNSTWTYDVLVTGRASNGNSASYHLRGAIKNNAGTTALVSPTPPIEILGEDVAAWDATMAADNANSALVVKVTGAAATSIRWVAKVKTVEVAY